MKEFKLFITAWFIAMVGSVGAQDINPHAIEFAKTITVSDLSNHLHIIASDEYEGRETGLKGQKLTEEYLTKFYESVGIKKHQDTYVQNYEVILRDPKNVDIGTRKNQFTFLEEYYYFPGMKDTVMNGELLFAGYGISDAKYNDVEELSFEDKIVIIKDGEPKNFMGDYVITDSSTPGKWSTIREKKINFFEEKGASALFIIKKGYSDNLERLKNYFSHKTMGLAYKQEVEKAGMPVFYISEDMAKKLLGKKKYLKSITQPKEYSGITAKEKVTIAFRRNENKMNTSNVLAYIPGTDKANELIIISAHYDHIGTEGDLVFNGADDDGSGTVAVMEIAQAFQKAKEGGHGPRRSLLFLNVSGEEKGLLGSEYYSDHPVFPLENTVANLNIDMIGRLDANHQNDSMYVYIIGSDMLSDELHQVNEEAQKKYSDIRLDYTFNSKDDPNRFYYRSDHYNFAKNNIPVIFYFTGVHEDYHKATDTVDKIMFGKLEKITRLIFHTAWDLANREERIKLNNP